MLATLPPSAAAQDEPFHASVQRVDVSEFPLVGVYVDVADPQGRPITGLSRDAFKLAEDGTPVSDTRLSAVTDSQLPIAVAMVLDVSGSMNDGGKLDAAKQAADGLVAGLGPADTAAVISFSDNVSVSQEFTANQQQLSGAINRLEATGGTTLYDAIIRAELLAQALPQPRKLLLVVTDGADSASHGSLDDAVAAVKGAHSMVYTVGLGGDVDHNALDSLAQSGGGQAFYPDRPDQIPTAFQTIENQLRYGYLLRYESAAPPDNKMHDLDVAVTYQGQDATGSLAFQAYQPVVNASLTGVSSGETVDGPRTLQATVRSGAPQGLQLLIDGQVVAATSGQPDGLSWDMEGLPPGDHTATLKVIGASGDVSEQSFRFTTAAPPPPPAPPAPAETAAPPAPPPSPTLPFDNWGWVGMVLAGLLGLLLIVAAIVLPARRRRREGAAGVSDADNTQDMEPEPAVGGAAAPSVQAATDAPRLHIRDAGPERDVMLTTEPLTLGRQVDNDVVLKDAHVSRHHARIVFEDGQYWIEDLNSANGTVLNGLSRVQRQRLASGDTLTIGAAEITFLWSQARPAAPTAPAPPVPAGAGAPTG
jgi:Ca-activated chloride channel family protein